MDIEGVLAACETSQDFGNFRGYMKTVKSYYDNLAEMKVYKKQLETNASLGLSNESVYAAIAIMEGRIKYDVYYMKVFQEYIKKPVKKPRRSWCGWF